MFREEFEKVSASMKEASDGMLSGVFLDGLKEEIWEKVMLFKAQTLREITEMAQKMEDQNYVLQEVQGFKFDQAEEVQVIKQLGLDPIITELQTFLNLVTQELV